MDRGAGILLCLLCLTMGVFTSAVVVIGFAATKESFSVAIAGTSIGLVNLFPFAGGAVMQPVLGAVLEHGGRSVDVYTVAAYRQAFVLLLGCALVALCASLCVREPETLRDEP